MTAGWVLLAFLGFLSLFSARKRLSMLPLGSAYAWRLLHEALGLVALALFWLHARTLWPKGLYEQILASFFYAVAFSGCAGSVLQRVYPSRLTRSGFEIIYERIPAELAQIRSQAEALAGPPANAVGTHAGTGRSRLCRRPCQFKMLFSAKRA